MMAEQEQQETPRVEIAQETMHGDLMALVIDELKAAPRTWHELGEDEQDEIIDRVKRRVGEAIEDCVRMIATAGFTRIPATLDAVQVKDGIKVTLSLSQHHAGRHDLVDAQGSTVCIVLANVDQFGGGTEALKAEPAQGDMLVSRALDRLGKSQDAQPEDPANG
jgi:hypothetical protein